MCGQKYFAEIPISMYDLQFAEKHKVHPLLSSVWLPIL